MKTIGRHRNLSAKHSPHLKKIVSQNEAHFLTPATGLTAESALNQKSLERDCHKHKNAVSSWQRCGWNQMLLELKKKPRFLTLLIIWCQISQWRYWRSQLSIRHWKSSSSTLEEMTSLGNSQTSWKRISFTCKVNFRALKWSNSSAGPFPQSEVVINNSANCWHLGLIKPLVGFLCPLSTISSFFGSVKIF